ncbi:Uncharacterised protein [Vibrio cholerae]|nr:Uncharacterised protein [Vibrio cholerae]
MNTPALLSPPKKRCRSPDLTTSVTSFTTAVISGVTAFLNAKVCS